VAQRSLHDHARSYAVIHHDHGATLRHDVGSQPRVVAPALLDRGKLAHGGACDVIRAGLDRAHDLVVEHDHWVAAVGDGPDGELWLVRRADLAYKDNVERSLQCFRDLGGDRHAAARQGQDQRSLQPTLRQPFGQ
jgi:hypothetical protein